MLSEKVDDREHFSPLTLGVIQPNELQHRMRPLSIRATLIETNNHWGNDFDVSVSPPPDSVAKKSD
jgi:hypothetical protein